MSLDSTTPNLVFMCGACGGRIQTPPQFAGVAAPCPFCARTVTAPTFSTPPPPQPAAVPLAQQPQPQPAVRRVPVPAQADPLVALPASDPDEDITLSKWNRKVEIVPRTLRSATPTGPQAQPTATVPTAQEPTGSKLERLFESMVELEGRLDKKLGKKVPFEKPLRRTNDYALRPL